MAKLHHAHPGLLVVRRKKQTMVPISKDVLTIGRKHADILLDDAGVSSTHAEVRRQGNKIVLVDLKSTNGTFVNRKSITECELTDQDVIEIGATTLCFYDDLREFKGETDQPLTPRAKVDTNTYSGKEIVTTTKTMAQPECRIQIKAGPDKGKKYAFRKSHILIGRRDADLSLLDVDISRSHAMIEVFSTKNIYIRDLSSTNGTFVNGKKIQSSKLKSGDEILVGNSTLVITLEDVA